MVSQLKSLFKLSLLVALLNPNTSYAEDIDLYVRSIADRVGTAPQVLIIFDNSGSMANSETVKSSYDPAVSYDGFYDNGANDRAVFFAVGAVGLEQLPVPDDERRFNELINACNQSFIPLYGLWENDADSSIVKNGYTLESEAADGVNPYLGYTLIEGGQGFYADRVGEYYSTGNDKLTWQSLRLNNGMNATDIMECLGDVLKGDQANPGEFGAQNGGGTPVGDGFPVEGYKVGGDAITHLPADHEDYADYKADFSKVNTVTLYSGNYLNWLTSETDYSDTSDDVEEKSRLEIAQEAISSVINATANVDFGLALFNLNHEEEGSNDGGRIVSKIQTRTALETDTLLNTISDIQAETNTPLCETLYEAYRYFGGESVQYGNENGTGSPNTVILPEKDSTAEESNTYISPFGNNCRNESYVIIITDGAPTVDSNANGAIASLPGANTNYVTQDSYLPVLSHWMVNNDVNANLDGNQHVVTYTIGFALPEPTLDPDTGEPVTTFVDAEPILIETAEKGEGAYYAASDPSELASALQKALLSIIEESASFTSPSVASNNFDQTRSLDSVYYSMFFPNDGPRWPGNLKKLKVTNNAVVDENGVYAIDNNGNIVSSAYTFWGGTSQCTGELTSCADGNDVDRGGVAEYLSSVTPANRNIKFDKASSTLASFTKTNIPGSGSDTDILTAFGVPTSELDFEDAASMIKWVRGEDIYDEDNDTNTTTRTDIFGDPLHSKPLVLNYGGSSADNQDLRIVVGTNAGFLHMFDDQGTSIVENWAFMPQSLFSNIYTLKENNSGDNKVYGMDGSPIAHIEDTDGVIGEGDKVWLYTGMRRGGNQYFGFDVTTPSSPSLMWSITGGSSEFPTLGQSWSQPNIAYIKMASHSDAKPVLIFGAGYVNDSDSTAANTLGRGVYIVDAETGARLWSFTPDSTLSNNTVVNMLDAMPAKVSALDSDFDGYVDRLYASDLGGNLWRMDLYSSDTSKWTAYKLATLSGEATADKRKFFNEPTVVRTFFKEKKLVSIDDGDTTSSVVISKEIPYEGILLGSGDRADPNGQGVNNKLYLIQDRNIITDSYTTPPSWSGITEDDLFDMTDDPFTSASNDSERDDIIINGLSTAKGWFIDLTRTGEKSLSSARVIAGVAYFTSYTPPPDSVLSNTCEIKAGGGVLYAMDLSYGTQVYEWREKDVGNRIPDTPVTYAGETEDGESLLSFIGVGQGEDGTGVIKARASTGALDFGLKTYKLHQRVTEQE